MMNDDKNLPNQELSATLEQMRQNLYKAVDNTVAAIARICVNLTPTELAELIRLFLGSAYETPAAAQAPIRQTIETQPENETKSQTALQSKAPVKRHRVTDWTQSSDNVLRKVYSYRRCQGLEIEPELSAELGRRFPGYDMETNTFTGKRPKDSAKIKSLGELSDATLRKMFNKVRKDGEISAELNAELSRRFPEYDAKAQTFARKRNKDWTKSSDKSLRNIHSRRQLLGQEIEPELSAELGRRFPGYDMETNTFTGKGSKRDATTEKRKVSPGRKAKPLGELSDATLRMMYNKARNNGEISAELNAELGRRFPAYDAKTRTFVRLYRGERIATKADIEEIEHQQALAAARRREEERAKKAAQLRAAGISSAKTTTPHVADMDDSDLVVTTKCLRISQNGPHYDVFVNGKRILHNHIGTKLQTFLNGTVLGVYGCVTDIPNFPDNPSWQVYDTNMKRRTFSQVHTFTKKSVYIKDIRKIGETTLRLEVSNKMLVLLDQRPSQRIFKIQSEKTK